MEKSFSKENIFKYYLYRDIDQYQRQNHERSEDKCKKYLEPYLAEFRTASGWDTAELAELEQELLSELEVDNRLKYLSQVDPIPWDGNRQTVLNEVARASSNFRDRFIVERIAVGLEKYDRLFVVYGASHALRQEPALRALFSSF